MANGFREFNPAYNPSVSHPIRIYGVGRFVFNSRFRWGFPTSFKIQRPPILMPLHLGLETMV